MARTRTRTRLAARPNNSAVDCWCYYEWKHFPSRAAAISFYTEGMLFSEGAELDRYAAIYAQLADGAVKCTDGCYRGEKERKAVERECGLAELTYEIAPMDGAYKGKFMIVDNFGNPALTGMTREDAEWALENIVKKEG